MKVFSMFITVLFAAPAVYASCPTSLPHEQLIDCIVNKNADGVQQPEVIAAQIINKKDEPPKNVASNKLAELQARK